MIRLYNNRQFDLDDDWSLSFGPERTSVQILPNSAKTFLDSSFYIRLWLNRSVAFSSSEGILTHGSFYTVSGGQGIGLAYLTSGDAIRLSVGNGTTGSLSIFSEISSSDITTNTWHCIEVWVNRENNLAYFWLNGVAKGAEIATDTGSWKHSSAPFLLGQYGTYTSDFWLRNTRLSNVLISSVNYQGKLLNHRFTGREPGLIGYWPGYRDTRDLTRLTDISNNANHGLITGAQWVMGYQLMGEESFSLGDVKLATADGEAMIWVDGLDLSGYAGALGNTDYFVRLTDDAGVMASAYCAGAGEGLTLGVESLQNGDFTNWTLGVPNNWNLSASDANNYIAENPAGTFQLVSNNTLAVYISQLPNPIQEPGKLYSFAFEAEVNSGYYRYGNFSAGRGMNLRESNINGNIQKYFTATGVGGGSFGFARSTAGSCNYHIDNVSLKKVTDVPTTGLRLVSSLNGSTRNMASVESGFNPNNVNKIEIFRV